MCIVIKKKNKDVWTIHKNWTLNKNSGKLSEFVENDSDYCIFVDTLRETCRTTSDFDIVFTTVECYTY